MPFIATIYNLCVLCSFACFSIFLHAFCTANIFATKRRFVFCFAAFLFAMYFFFFFLFNLFDFFLYLLLLLFSLYAVGNLVCCCCCFVLFVIVGSCCYFCSFCCYFCSHCLPILINALRSHTLMSPKLSCPVLSLLQTHRKTVLHCLFVFGFRFCFCFLMQFNFFLRFSMAFRYFSLSFNFFNTIQ